MADKEKNLHAGHRGRLMNKLLSTQEQDILPHELVEALLFYPNKRGDKNPLAHRLIDTFGSVGSLLQASQNEIMKVRGAGKQTADFLVLLGILVRHCGTMSSAVIFFDIEDELTHRYLRSLFYDMSREQVYMLFLDSRNIIVKKMLMFEGTFESVCIDVAELLRTALLCRARSVVCVHNHPSGIAVASAADTTATRRLSDSFSMIGIELTEHVIVTEKELFGIRSLYRAKLSNN